ncbi:hypothetical protein ISS37_02795 [candidate division KSB1 bacterium]|nr:hypothetical protein [candidate division KSB1 bacterium]
MRRHWFKEDQYPYFITNTIVDWINVFYYKNTINIIIDSFHHFQREREVDFIAFGIMPSHLHYIPFPRNPDYTISHMQRDFKKFTSKRIVESLQNSELILSPFFQRLSPKLEERVSILLTFERAGKIANQNFKVWFSDDKPEVILTEQFLRQKIEYIHNNPVQKGIVIHPWEYPYSSARNYFLDDESFFKVLKDW